MKIVKPDGVREILLLSQSMKHKIVSLFKKMKISVKINDQSKN